MDGELVALATTAEGEDPIQALRAVAELRRQVDRLAAVQVRRARVQGVSWVQIAQALGVSKQAVHKKFGGRRIFGGSCD
jgi:DNA invertase Pin-like site-specific DNA recombinase